MAEITVSRIEDDTFEVVVADAITTSHRVTVKSTDYERLTGGSCSEEELLERSFHFLLEREPNTSILSQFDLMVIQQYFPEYERVMTA